MEKKSNLWLETCAMHKKSGARQQPMKWDTEFHRKKEKEKDTQENTQAAIETCVELHATCHIFSKAVNDFFLGGKCM